MYTSLIYLTDTIIAMAKISWAVIVYAQGKCIA